MKRLFPDIGFYAVPSIFILMVGVSQAATVDLAPYFGLNPGNLLTYRTKTDSQATWTPGEHSVIGNPEQFQGKTAVPRKWYDPGVAITGTPSATDYINIVGDEICIYGQKTGNIEIIINPPNGLCFPRSVTLPYSSNAKINIKSGILIIPVDFNVTIDLPSGDTALPGAFSTLFMEYGFASEFLTATTQSWLAFGTGVIKRYKTQGLVTSEITAFDPAPASVCNPDALTISTTTFNSTSFGAGAHNRSSGQSITTQGSVQLLVGANATFRAPILHLGAGFKVPNNATFLGQTGPVTCTLSSGKPLFASSVGLDTRLVPTSLGTVETLESPQSIAQLASLRGWLRDLLSFRGVDLSAASHGSLDPQGHWLLFETSQDLVAADTNGMSDIYRFDLVNENLSLISGNAEGRSGTGPSRYPAADALGNWVAFQSDAEDLTEDDTNGVTDIFLYDLLLGQIQRVTADAESASAHPTLDAAGAELAYDQQDEAGYRYILAVDPWMMTPSERISLLDDEEGMPLDNHHPALSADGRFIAYVEEGRADQSDRCQVHFVDRDSGRFQRLPCPAASAASSDKARPLFSPYGAWLQWDLGDGRSSAMLNPLADAPLNPAP